jgi:phosphoglycerate dehydrogenase-like enzyme
MRVLFLGSSNQLQPWFDDVLKAVNGRWAIDLFDPAKPIAEQFQGVGVVVDQGSPHGTRQMIDAAIAAGVKLWQALSVGVDRTDVAYLLEKGLPLANTPGPFSAAALSEHAIFLMLLFAKNFFESQNKVRSKLLGKPINEELQGKTLGLLGLGASGQALAKRAAVMGMHIMAADGAKISPTICEECHLDFFGPPEDLDSILTAADYLSIHVPLTSKTKNMVSRKELKQMKPTAVLINVARGGIVEEAALIEALQNGWLRGAGLDVFSVEPVDPNHPLLQLNNVIATPHIAGVTYGTSRRRGEVVAENIERIVRGLQPLYQITSVE